jgi:hypothetical protein
MSALRRGAERCCEGAFSWRVAARWTGYECVGARHVIAVRAAAFADVLFEQVRASAPTSAWPPAGMSNPFCRHGSVPSSVYAVPTRLDLWRPGADRAATTSRSPATAAWPGEYPSLRCASRRRALRLRPAGARRSSRSEDGEGSSAGSRYIRTPDTSMGSLSTPVDVLDLSEQKICEEKA